MSIVLVGVNHKTAPVEVRELLAFSDEACAVGLRRLVDGDVVREGLIVSTCNRVEILSATTAEQLQNGTERITQFLDSGQNLPPGFLGQHIYSHTDDEAVRHLFRVASSLDSMVVGEPQVLGQVRRAYSLAVEAGTAGRVLNRLVHHTFRVAKRVRSETGIAANAVSISYMAVELGKKIFDSLKGHSVLLIGAGEMAELSAKHLLSAGASRIRIVNRTPEAAQTLASEFDGEAVPFAQLDEALAEADVVICSTASPEFVITEEMTRKAREKRRNRPMCMIDISVPRNIDPNAGKVPNVFRIRHRRSGVSDYFQHSRARARGRARGVNCPIRSDAVSAVATADGHGTNYWSAATKTSGDCTHGTGATTKASGYTHTRARSCARTVADVDGQQDLTSGPKSNAPFLRG